MSWILRSILLLTSVLVGCGDDRAGTHDAGAVHDAAGGDAAILRPTGWRELPLAVWSHGESPPVLTPDGRIILVGGVGQSSQRSTTVQQLDPSTGAWLVGDQGVTASLHTATLLPDGDILVVGSAALEEGMAARIPAARGMFNKAYLVGPDLRATEITGPGTLHAAHAAVLLGSGEVLVAGGATLDGELVVPTAVAELYDPATSGWRGTGPLAEARFMHTATVLPSGEVLVVGGRTMDTFLASAEIYDPAAGSWRAAAPMTTARSNHAAVLLGSGRVLVAGGVVAEGATAEAEVYDPSTDRWSPVPAMTRQAAYSAGATLPSGDAIVVGGAGSDLRSEHGQALVFDDAAEEWVPMDDLPGGTTPGGFSYEGRFAAGVVVLPDGHVVVTSGLASRVTVEVPLISDGAFE